MNQIVITLLQPIAILQNLKLHGCQMTEVNFEISLAVIFLSFLLSVFKTVPSLWLLTVG